MNKLLLVGLLFLISCAGPTAFLGDGLLSLGLTQSVQQTALSTGTDYLIKEKTGKNKLEFISSKALNKDCAQEKLVLNCK